MRASTDTQSRGESIFVHKKQNHSVVSFRGEGERFARGSRAGRGTRWRVGSSLKEKRAEMVAPEEEEEVKEKKNK